jgi:hypothetical protein
MLNNYKTNIKIELQYLAIEGIIRTFLHIRQIKAKKWGKIDFSK